MEAFRAAAERNITISVALNHRSKLWQYGKSPSEMMPELVEYCDLIVGGSYEAHDHDFAPVAIALRERFPQAARFVTTLRESFSASHNTYTGLLWDGETMHSSPTYQLTHIVDRVGGGRWRQLHGGVDSRTHQLAERPDLCATFCRRGLRAEANDPRGCQSCHRGGGHRPDGRGWEWAGEAVA